MPAAFVGAGLTGYNGFVAKDPLFLAACAVLLVIAGVALALIQTERFVNYHRWAVRRAAVRANFSGLLASKTVRQLERSSYSLSSKPRERVVTVMFVDMAGFSLSTERHDALMMFSELQKFSSAIQGLVHRFGGTVEKTQGDGILCYFGFDLITGRISEDHARQAIGCAMAIQRASLKLAARALAQGGVVHPLRIGINTGAVVIGDIGNGERFDFTIVGHGVNYAKRMEQCCELFKVMISSTTKELLRASKTRRWAIAKKLVQLKHFDDLRDAYEIDPFPGRRELVEKAIAAYRRGLGIQRKQERFQMGQDDQVEAYTDFGSAVLIDHSFSGLGVAMSRYLANGCDVTLRLDSSARVGQDLRRYGIQEIVGEVRWGQALGPNSYHHGLFVKNLSHRQLGVLHAVLSRTRSRRPLNDAS